MSEKIEIRSTCTSVEWALIAVIIAETEGADILNNHTPEEPLDVELRIDGVECKFSTIINRLMEEYDRCVTEKAVELLHEKAKKFIDAASRAKIVLDEATNQLAKDLGVEIPEE